MEDGSRKYGSSNNELIISTSGTPVPLSATSSRFKRLTVQAKETNGGNILLGGSNLDSDNAIQLTPTATHEYLNGDLSFIYVDGVNTEGINLEIET